MRGKKVSFIYRLALHYYTLQNECSFVSLRDIDRAVTVFIFFHKLLSDTLNMLIDEKVKNHEPIKV